MKARVLILVVVLLVLITGCRAEEPLDSGIIPYQDRSAGKFADFFQFPVVTEEPDPDGVRLDGVGIAADGAYVMVGFTMPLSLQSRLQQGYIYVVDEETRVIYKDIPVMPIVGPLMGRAAQEGQGGYVMLVNYSQGVKTGSVVTVVLGKYKREHVTVK